MGFKLISLTLLIFAIAAAGGAGLILAVPAALSLLLISRKPFRQSWKTVKAPLILLAAMAPFILLMPGTPIGDRFSLLLAIMAKSLSIFAVLSVAAGEESPQRLAAALKKLGIPGKLISILFSTYRYINLYVGDLEKLRISARLRGFSAMKGFAHMGASTDILLTLLIRSYEQSERVQAAMRARGFNGSFPLLDEKTGSTVKERKEAFTALIFSAAVCILEFLC